MISIEKLKIEYDEDIEVIGNLSLEIKEGESVAVLGANGAGKTTLLHTLVGLIEMSDGEIVIDKLALKKENLLEIRKKTGLIFQNPDDQLFMPTVLDDVAFAPANCKTSILESEKKAEEILKKFSLEEIKDVSPFRLSGGEKRLVAIAGILITNPKIILFDEPTAYLDYPAKKMLIEIIKKLKVTKIIASHDIRFCKEVCQRAIVLKNGAVALDVPMAEIENERDVLEECGIEPV